MSKEENKNKVRGVLAEIVAGTGKSEKSGSKENQESDVSQTITSGSNNIQISGNSNSVAKR